MFARELGESSQMDAIFGVGVLVILVQRALEDHRPRVSAVAAYVVRGEYGVPPMVPDFVVEQMMKVPESENLQRKQLAWLQKRSRQ